MKKLFYILSVLFVFQISNAQYEVTSLRIKNTPTTVNDSTTVDVLVRQKTGTTDTKGMVRRVTWGYLASILSPLITPVTLQSAATNGSTISVNTPIDFTHGSGSTYSNLSLTDGFWSISAGENTISGNADSAQIDSPFGVGAPVNPGDAVRLQDLQTAVLKTNEGEQVFSDTGTIANLNWGTKKTMRWAAANNSSLNVYSINDPNAYPGKEYIITNATISTDPLIESNIYLYNSTYNFGSTTVSGLRFNIPNGATITNGTYTALYPGKSLKFVYSATSGMLELSGANVTFDDLKRITSLPEDFIIWGNNAQAYNVRYLPRDVDVVNSTQLSQYVTITRPAQVFNEILRNGNDLFLLSSGSTTSSTNQPYIMVLYNCRLVNNVLTWDKMTQSLINIPYRIHGTTFHNGFIFGVNANGNMVVKVNPYDLADQKTLTFPTGENVLGMNDIEGYNEYLYTIAYCGPTPYSQKIIRFDENLNGYTVIANYLDQGNGQPFVIYNGEIYISKAYDGQNKKMSVNVYSLDGVLLRQGPEINLTNTGTGSIAYDAHWMTVFNGKLIITSSLAIKHMVRIDLQTLQVDGANAEKQFDSAITDDNTINKDGFLYIFNESTVTGVFGTHKIKYNDFSNSTLVTTVGSAGGLVYNRFNKIAIKQKLSQFTQDAITPSSVTTSTLTTSALNVNGVTGLPINSISINGGTPMTADLSTRNVDIVISGGGSVPLATNTTNGILKLNTSISTNTDGAPANNVVKTALDGKVNNTGNETIAGDKTFTGNTSLGVVTIPVNPTASSNISDLYLTIDATTKILKNTNPGYAPSTGGVFTVSSTAPTSSTGLATNIGRVYGNILAIRSYVAKTVSYTLLSTDDVVEYTASTASTLTTPALGSTFAGKKFYIINNGTGVVTMAGQTINGLAASNYTISNGGYLYLVADGTNYKVLEYSNPNGALITTTVNYTTTATVKTIKANGTLTVSLLVSGVPDTYEYVVKDIGTGTVTINVVGGGTIDGVTSKTLNVTNSFMRLQKDGSNYIIVGQ